MNIGQSKKTFNFIKNQRDQKLWINIYSLYNKWSVGAWWLEQEHVSLYIFNYKVHYENWFLLYR